MNTLTLPLNASRFPARRRATGVLAAVGLALLLAGCASPTVERYASETPALDLRQYFNGKLTAHGVFRDRSGAVVRRFTVDMTGTWQGPRGQETGVLDERFTYLDAERKGQTDRRVWRLKHVSQQGGVSRYEGTADDVVGVAQGQTAGNAFNWQYTLKLPVDGRVIEVQFDDWMYLVDQKIMLNHAVMSKWGVRLGDVQIAFTREPS